MRINAAAVHPAVVLIASKQEWTSRSLESILVPQGYVVLRSYSAMRARERAQRDRPDAIIIDVELADETGHELCCELRAQELVTASTPILLTLPKPPTRRDRLAALHAGAWECLGEPLDAEEVLATLEAFVPAKRQSDQARAAGLLDEATGLYNARGLTRRAREWASYASRNDVPLACVVFEPEPALEKGGGAPPRSDPAVWHSIAQVLKSAGRRCDATGRVGPSGFAVVAPGTDSAQARRLAERLGAAILTSLDPPAAGSFRLHAGWHGVPPFHAAGIDATDLIRRATAALRKARTKRAAGSLRGLDEGNAVTLG